MKLNPSLPLKRTGHITRMSSTTKLPGYNKLPTELKLQVIREAVAELRIKLCHDIETRWPRKAPLARYACLDVLWQEVIERFTFDRLSINGDDIEEFGKICCKRQGILREIGLFTYSPKRTNEFFEDIESIQEVDIDDVKSEIKARVQALFNIMKDWKPEKRKRPGLIAVDVVIDSVLTKPVSVDFSGLPTVSVIGRFGRSYGNYMDLSTTIEIYRKLPNLDEVSLNLFWQPTESEFFTESMSKLRSLGSSLPSLLLFSLLLTDEPSRRCTPVTSAPALCSI